LVGAFLYAQLEKAEKIIKARRRIFQRYYDILQPLEEKGFLSLPTLDDKCINNGHTFYIITPSLKERTQLIEHLKTKDILAIFHYVPLHSSPAGVKYGRISGSMSVTNDLSERILRLPMYYTMSNEDVDRVSGEILNFYMRLRAEKLNS
jgi:dTDP-4-amino-4,6-dideoxygalactose transaminase